MGERKFDFAREISQAIDKMLAGEKAEPHAAMSDDYREAIDFAQRLISLKGTPRPSFKAELKDSLLAKLSEMEQKKAERIRFWEMLRHLVPQRPVWRTVAASLLVIVVVGGVIWGSGILKQPSALLPEGMPPEEAPPPAPSPPRLCLGVEAAPAKTVYLPGDEVEIQFEFKNVSTEPITVTPFPPLIGITPPVTVHWKEQIIRSFPTGSEELHLQPGEIAVYTLIWDQKDNSGQQVAPGYYGVNADIKAQVVEADGSKSAYGTSGRVTKLLIQFPQGAMEKNIEANQAQTVTGLPFTWKREELSIDLTITLERAELTADGAKFSAFATSPNSPSAGYDHPQWSGPVWAQYTVDGVIKDAGLAGMRYLDDGIQLCWGDDTGLDPLPSDAKELTFTITEFGDWEGPWEFRIPLG
jgi:hypothetical protein